MSTDPSTADFLRDQMAGAGDIRVAKMFGEYGVYCDGKVVALICDDQLFVKPTPGARALIASPVEAPAYPGAKPYLLVTDEIDDPDLLACIIAAVARDLPEPKPKKPKTPKKGPN